MPLGDVAALLAVNLLMLWALLLILWAVSVRLKDASIIDMFWGPACAFGAVSTYFRADGVAPRDTLLTALVCLWAARLSLHLARRNLGHGEDYRYRSMRERRRSDKDFARWSLVWVFGLQGLIAWVVSWPVQLGQLGGSEELGVFAYAGAAIFLFGFGFEAVGDAQLRRFKKNPSNAGKLLTHGLWAWTRHPNYFGDAAVWAGLSLIALESTWGPITLISPIVMTHFLVNVSGKALLEKRLARKYSGYEDYKRRTSGFFPLPPRP